MASEKRTKNLLELDNLFGVPKRDGVTDVSTFDYESLFCRLINHPMADLNLRRLLAPVL